MLKKREKASKKIQKPKKEKHAKKDFKLTLRLKLTIIFLIVGIVPMAIALFIGYRNSSKTISKQSFAQLVSVRESKKSEIKDYFETIEHQVITLSENSMTVDAMRDFRPAFHGIKNELGLSSSDIEIYRKSVANYYTNEFYGVFKSKSIESVSPESLIPREDSSIIFQYNYISNNKNPLGNKDALIEASDGSGYSLLHKKYHPIFRSYLEKFGFYDIFLVDAKTGHIVYSVFKELDYSTNINSGQYGGSGIGRAFKMARDSGAKDSASLTDFKPYVPSYTAPASFISSPVFDRGKMIGVLIFQMPIDKINSIMTSAKRWKDIGL
ncbi:MAG: methyl-accepting chemotaxis protein, partial [Thermodesulfobacteriota bacterium]